MGPGQLNQDAVDASVTFSKNERQFGVVYDLIAAGEINGLVGGLSGVFLNNTPLIDHAKYKKLRLRTATGVSINGNANTITKAGLFNGITLDDGDRYVQMVGTGGGASPGCITTSLSGAVATGTDRITVASSVFIAGTHDVGYTGVSSPFLSDHVGYKIRITGAGLDGTQYKGIILNVISGTEATIFPPLPTGVSSGTTVFIDNFYKVASISSTATAVLENFTPTTNFTNSSVVLSAATTYYNDRSQAVNYDNAYIDFRNGSRYQVPVEAAKAYAAPSASYMIAPGNSLTWFAGTGGKTLSPGNATASATFITPSQFNFAQNVKDEIDRINITIDFPSGLRYISPKGNDGPAAVEFQIILHYKTDASESSFKTELIFGRDYGGANFIDGVHQADSSSTTKSNNYSWITASTSYDHQDKIDDYFGSYASYSRRHPGTVVRRGQSASFVHEFPIFLADRQPLHDWKIEVRRLTPDNSTHWNPVEIDGMGAQLFASCNIKTVEAQIIDKFTYPTSAYAVVSYAAEDFSSPPKRAYRIQGRKVKVPTNYITREEAGSNQAKYTRNISTGVDTNTYQSWNGSFRGDQSLAATSPNYKKVYTSNPAWIFYDILTDKEIGLGDYIEEADVDKYALFQIGRYCDQLVPNGKGGLEPRFACNVYLTSQSEAYKVLKDLASSFRAMMYWIDGEIVAIQDSPKEPVYSFTTGNVENGVFSYTYTGQRARVNQINVTWNNPLEMYKKTVLTVEDTQNIESVGKIIPNDIVAFGCTSEGQARRLADWHLATVKQEAEVVSFTTGLNAAFLRPGDIVNVQDKHRHGFEVSGRVSASSSTNSINLDRTITAPGGGNLNGCNLYLIYTEPGIYLKQESATINSIAYSRGEILVEDASGNSLATQAQAANLLDDSGAAVLTQFSKNSRVEVKAITTNASSASTITVSGAFSSAPQQDTVWAISRKDDINTDDIKEYRVLSIAQAEENTFEISASSYSKDKYDEIDADVPVVTNDYVPAPKMSDPVPAPTGLGIEQLPSSTTSNEGTGTTVSVVASWTAPVESFTDSNGTVTNIAYRFLSGFEIQHTFPTGNESSSWTTVRDINGNANTFTFSNVDAGTYTIRVRAVNTLGNYSAWNEVTRQVFSLPPGTSRISRVSRGGFLTFSPEIDASTGLVSIDATAYRYIHPSGEEYIFNPASTAQLQQAFNSLPAGQTAFWVFDASNTSDPWIAMQLHTDSVATDATGNASKFNYLKTIGASNNGLTAASGTVTVASGSTEVTGNSTAFTTDYYVGGFIKISTNSAAGTQVANSEYREVVEIESNTKLFVRNPFTRGFTGQNPMKQTTGIRFQEDAILAEITRASSGSSPYTAEFYVQGKGAGGSDTVKTVHVFRSGTKPGSPPVPTTAEMGREPVAGDFVIVHYTDANVSFTYDGSSFNVKTAHVDGQEVLATSIDAGAINVGSITIGDIGGAGTFKGAFTNLSNPGSAITPTDDTAANAAQSTATTANSRAQNFDTSGDIFQGISVGTGGHVRGGQSAFNNGIGFFLGYSGSAYKFSIGNSSGQGLTWNGSTLGINGNISFANSPNISTFTNDSGFTDDTAANSAQSTANTAVTNAATAQTTANTGVTNAAAAQTTANTGVTNAAAAQGTANTANSRAQNFDTSGDIFQGINTGTGGHIRGGQSAFNNGTGYFLGYSGSAYKFSIGNSSGQGITWNGSALTVNGTITIANASSLNLSSFNNDSGFTDDTAANAAQGTANTAVTNAATAQNTANTGVANAATAQATANSKITAGQVNANVTSIGAGVITTGTINANRIGAGSITARELQISNSSSGSAGVYVSSNAIEIHDGTRVRVKIGAL